jgi:hypothetical protein
MAGFVAYLMRIALASKHVRYELVHATSKDVQQCNADDAQRFSGSYLIFYIG